jgi:putative ABC transport system ATP-binding protein
MSAPAQIPPILLSVRNLSRRFREGTEVHNVLKDVSIDVAAGESVALRGRSGSGKSTLLNLISGIDTPDSGEVWIAGKSITGMSEYKRTIFRREFIGFVYQAFNLVPTLTVAENVGLVLELNGIREPESGERVSHLLADVGLAQRADSYPDILSGGEQQRVALARAVAHKPILLLADEPTGNLDEQSARNVMSLFEALVRNAGGTMIIATHSATVAASCDRVLELRDGMVLV